MSVQAYLDNIKTKTGKTPDDFRKLAHQKGLVKFGEVVAWLKTDFELGHGHASLIAQLVVNADQFKASAEDQYARHFAGAKLKWRAPFDALQAKLVKFGSDVTLAPNRTYINLLRGTKKFGIVQISSADRIDLGIKFTAAPASDRLEAAGAWNAMVTHRLRITDPKQLNAEVIRWLKQAYQSVAE